MSKSATLDTFCFLTPPEVRFLEAAAERLIPTDELKPGGCDAGVAVYIDRQLSSAWGVHGRNYRSGPWPEGTSEQGFQSRVVPQAQRGTVRSGGLRQACHDKTKRRKVA